MKKQEFDIQKVICDKKEAAQRRLECPVCGCFNTHLNPPYLVVGEDWNGYGELAITPLNSECGCEWEVCIGFHKGDSVIFTRINSPCKVD